MIILAVDDEKASLALLKEAVETANPQAECYAFDETDDALEFAGANKVDIAFLDIHLRGMSGIDLAKRLKGTNPKINIVFVTGYAEYAIDALKLHASGYVSKPVSHTAVEEQMRDLLYPVGPSETGAFAKTFGHFEFFVDGKALTFKRSKAKELLALLVDREGASLTTEQMAAVLYEEKNYDRSVKNTLMPVIRCLQETLNEAGVGDVLIRTWGHLAVNVAKFGCDAYDYIAGKPEGLNAFQGEYLSNYSWAEDRAAEFFWRRENTANKNK